MHGKDNWKNNGGFNVNLILFIIKVSKMNYSTTHGNNKHVRDNGRLSFHPIPCGTAPIGHETSSTTTYTAYDEILRLLLGAG